jgi:hypothetical protein
MDRLIGIAAGRIVMDVRKEELLGKVDAMEQSGINAPLVLLVQHWLRQAGISFDHTSFEMEDLIGSLKNEIFNIKGQSQS